MEEVYIKEIIEKPTGLVIIKMNGNREATLNNKWQAEEVKYLKEAVGIGGSVKVVITQKGKYTNITEVDLSSAKKMGETGEQRVPQEIKGSENSTEKSISIISQVLVKCASQIVAHDGIEKETSEQVGRAICDLIPELYGAYKLAVDRISDDNNNK